MSVFKIIYQTCSAIFCFCFNINFHSHLMALVQLQHNQIFINFTYVITEFYKYEIKLCYD